MLNIIKIAYKSVNKDFKDYKIFIINNIVAFVSVFVFWSIFLYAGKLLDYGLLNANFIMLLRSISTAFSAVSVALIFYALKKFMVTRASEYHILLNLGMRRKHFYTFFLAEYGFILSISFIGGLLIGNFAARFLVKYIGSQGLLLKQISIDWFLINRYIILVYFIMISLAVLLFLIVQHKYSFCKYFEVLNKKNEVCSITFLNIIYFIIGIVLLLISFVVLNKYTVLKMYIAMAINVVGMFAVIYNIKSLKSVFKRIFKKQYYKSLLKFNHVILRMDQNKIIIWAVYVVNFVGSFVVAGLLTTYILDDTDYNILYPYDIVYDSLSCQNNLLNNESSSNIRFEIPYFEGEYRGHTVICIDIESYNLIEDSNLLLSEGELLFYDQRRPEEFAVLEDDTVNIDINGETGKYTCIDSGWKIIFGEKLSDRLEQVVVMNKEDFEQNNDKQHILGLIKYDNNADDGHKEKILNSLGKNAKVYSKNNIILTFQVINKFKIIIINVMGIFVLWSCCCFLYIQYYTDLDQLIEIKDTYQQLGVRSKKIESIFRCEMKYSYFAAEFGILTGTIYFISDCLYEISQISQLLIPLIIFGLIMISYNGCQLFIYSVFTNNLMKKLKERG